MDDVGALLFRDIEGGSIVRVRNASTQSDEVEVMSCSDAPGASFYGEQRLPTDGLGYITTRDGTTLSASVWLPGPADDGPYPTVVEYSGYTPSYPESQGFGDIFGALGYAYVGVNIRGTGCSGGSFGQCRDGGLHRLGGGGGLPHLGSDGGLPRFCGGCGLTVPGSNDCWGGDDNDLLGGYWSDGHSGRAWLLSLRQC